MRRRPMLSLVLLILASALMPVSAWGRDGQRGLPSEEGNARPDFDLPAVQLRLALDRVLAEHAFLSIEAMRTGIAGGAEFEVAADVLEANTTEVVDLVEAAYGADAADAFAEQWRNHIAYLVDYTRAVAEGDEDARELAASQLQTYTDDFSALLVAANPGLPPDVVEGLIQEHVQQLEQIGSFADAGFTDAYPAIRDTYAHMFMVGDGLTIGILSGSSDRFPGRDTAFSPALDMRVSLDRLLGEHTYLAAIAMRARLTDAPDFEAAADALGDNSAELAAQITQIYGEAGGEAFDALWRSHTSFYLDYVEASSEDNAAAKAEALDGLRQYGHDFSSFLAEANPFLDEGGLEALLATHTQHLVSQVSMYLDGDYEAAYTTLRQAYEHTESIAAGLAGAIADQFPRLFPDTATTVPTPASWLRRIAMLLGWTAVAIAAVLTAWRRRRANARLITESASGRAVVR
jgi:hypothetical protein